MDTLQIVKEICLKEKGKNPIKIVMTIMDNENVHIHGPEHHLIDGAALLTAMHNVKADFDLSTALNELYQRAQKMPGAMCGHWGICGSVASIGSALSVIHQTSPLSNDHFYQEHMFYTSQALNRIGKIGGPRCCKRNAFLSLMTAIDFVNEYYDIKLEKQQPICHYSTFNKQCLHERCPFYANK